MALVANTTVKQNVQTVTEYEYFLSGFTLVLKNRTNVVETWRAKLTDSTLPSPVGSGTRLVNKSATQNGPWYDYEETWETPGSWTT
jgi:hypothetical protein